MRWSNEDFGASLREELEWRGLGHKAFADMLFVDEAVVSLLVGGKRRPSVDAVCAIATVLGFEPQEVFGWGVRQ